MDWPDFPLRRPLPFTIMDAAQEYHEQVDWPASPYPMPVWMTPREQEELILLASDPSLSPGHIVEIGIGWAGSTYLLGKANALRELDNEHVWGIDLFTAAKDESGFRVQQAYRALRNLPRTHFLLPLTSCAVPILFPQPNIRLALIDGDHATEWVWRDVRNLAPSMVDGGLILVHDVWPGEPEGPAQVWDAAKDGLSIGNRVLWQDEIICTLAKLRVEVTDG